MKRKSANRKKRTVAVARPHVSETEALMQMARLINDQPDVDRVCQRIVQSVLTLLPVRFSAITLLDPDEVCASSPRAAIVWSVPTGAESCHPGPG